MYVFPAMEHLDLKENPLGAEGVAELASRGPFRQVRELDLSIQGTRTVGRLVGAPPAATTTNLAVGRERGRRGASERSNTAHGT